MERDHKVIRAAARPGNERQATSWRAHWRLKKFMRSICVFQTVQHAHPTKPSGGLAEVRLNVERWSPSFHDVFFLHRWKILCWTFNEASAWGSTAQKLKRKEVATTDIRPPPGLEGMACNIGTVCAWTYKRKQTERGGEERDKLSAAVSNCGGGGRQRDIVNPPPTSPCPSSEVDRGQERRQTSRQTGSEVSSSVRPPFHSTHTHSS